MPKTGESRKSPIRRHGFAPVCPHNRAVKRKGMLMHRHKAITDRTGQGPATELRALAMALAVAGLTLPVGMQASAQSTGAGLAEALGVVGSQGVMLVMDPKAQAEVDASLRRMDDWELMLTYARIHATFRRFLGHDDLSVARALIDYATLAQAELDRRGLPRPAGTESAMNMGIAFELVL